LAEARPEDVNVNAGIARTRGRVPFWEVHDAGFSTFDPVLGEQHAGRDRQVDKAMIDVLPLTDVIAEHRPTGDIHFLKVDVEGFEEEVIRSMDFKRFRPWIVLAEATAPGETRENHQSWEPLLLGAGYEFVYFDGLNRFYVAEEHSELKKAFYAPPNVFDNFRLPPFLCSVDLSEIEKLREEIHRLKRVEHYAYDMQNSLSWKVTAPLRWLRDRVG
jgi:FkbM family methyltransferase